MEGGGHVYNLNNENCRCRSQMYFGCTDLLKGVFSFFYEQSDKGFFVTFFEGWGGLGGTVTSCLILHEFFTKSND